jgi:hypothetical protein
MRTLGALNVKELARDAKRNAKAWPVSDCPTTQPSARVYWLGRCKLASRRVILAKIHKI